MNGTVARDLRWSDGVVTLRPLHPDDIDLHVESVDDEQIRWLWEPGDGDRYTQRTPHEQRSGHLSYLTACFAAFGLGPKWVFAGDVAEQRYAVYVDCDLANPHVPGGQANISYACHPRFRGRGYTSRAVRLVCGFLRDHTSATEAHIVAEEANVRSLGVARSVGARPAGSYIDEHGRLMVRYVIALGAGYSPRLPPALA